MQEGLGALAAALHTPAPASAAGACKPAADDACVTLFTQERRAESLLLLRAARSAGKGRECMQTCVSDFMREGTDCSMPSILSRRAHVPACKRAAQHTAQHLKQDAVLDACNVFG